MTRHKCEDTLMALAKAMMDVLKEYAPEAEGLQVSVHDDGSVYITAPKYGEDGKVIPLEHGNFDEAMHLYVSKFQVQEMRTMRSEDWKEVYERV